MNRRLAVGDIHGGYKALLQVLERAKYDPKKDKLFFLGDYVDGWSECIEVIDLLIKLKEEAKYPPVFLLGNHDDWLRQWLNYGIPPEGWLDNGGKITQEKYLIADKETLIKHREFLNKLDLYHITEDNIALSHAGYDSDKGMGNEYYHETYFWTRRLAKLAVEYINSDGPHLKFTKHKKVFIGHTSTLHYDTDKPIISHNVYNLDTGGGWYGKLTIFDMDSNEYYQSDLVQELYKEEKGRK